MRLVRFAARVRPPARRLLLGLALGWALSGCAVGPPPSDRITDFRDALSSPRTLQLGTGTTILGVVLIVPERPGQVVTPMLKAVESKRPGALLLPPLTPLMVTASLKKRGVYLSVLDWRGRFVSLIALGEPRRLRLEDFSNSAAPAMLFKNRAAAISVRVPFVRGGRISLYESDGSGLAANSKLLYELSLGLYAPTSEWSTYRVISG